MFYHLFYYLREHSGIFHVFHYVTFRAMVAFFLAFFLVLILEPWFIRWVRVKYLGQPIRDDGPQSHLSKKGTPTMGGLVVVLAIVVSTLLLADLANLYIWSTLGLTISYAALGFVDDYQKVRGHNSKGISARTKLVWQFGSAAFFVTILVAFSASFSTTVDVPSFKTLDTSLPWWLFIPFATLVVVGCSNAVNLTDGLDGLVIGPVMTVAFAYGIFAYIFGDVEHAERLGVHFISGVGDLSIFASAVVAGGLGFL